MHSDVIFYNVDEENRRKGWGLVRATHQIFCFTNFSCSPYMQKLYTYHASVLIKIDFNFYISFYFIPPQKNDRK